MDTATEKPANAKSAGFRAGAELREARERLGWDLGEVAAALRIKLAYLEAIEDGRVSALPGNAYALGFLRTYATTLGLDPDEVARRFKAEAHTVNRRTELAFPAPVPERGVPTGALVLIGLLIAAGGYGAWYKLSGRVQAPTHTVPPVPDSLLPARRAAPVSPQVASVLPPPGTAVPTLPQHSVAPPTPPPVPQKVPTGAAAVPAGTIAPAAPVALGSAPPAAAAVATPPGAGTAAVPAGTVGNAAPAPPAATPAAPPAGVVLHASAPTWVQVRGADRHVLYDHLMEPGDSWVVPAGTPGLVLTTGNAGGLSLSDGARTTPPLGKPGSVRHNVPLDPAAVDALAAGTPAQPAATVAPAAPAAAPAPRRATPPAAATDHSADQLNAHHLGH